MIVKPDPQPERWGIVGGGMLGLTLAHRMSKNGADVTLLEAAPKLGGLAAEWSLGEIAWDKYYHVILLSDSNLRSLLDEINLADQLKWAETKTGFYTNGNLYSMSDSVEFLKFPPLNLIEKIRLGGTIFYASKIRNWKRLEKLSVEKWLRRWSGNGAFGKIWEPLLNAKLGESYKITAASFIWAHINRMYKARRSGLKKEMFGYVEGGYKKIIGKLAHQIEQQSGKIETDVQIKEITKSNDGLFQVVDNLGQARIFDRIILTTPSNVAGKICPILGSRERQQLEEIDYLGIVCASMLTQKPISPYYVTNITDRWVPMTAVIEMSNIVDRSELGNKSLIYLPKYLPPGHQMFEMSDEEVETLFLDALEKMYPDFSRSDVETFRVTRTRNVMAIPKLRYSESLPPMKTSVEGLYLINSSYILKGNLNVNETIGIAEEAYEKYLAGELAATGALARTA